MTGSENTKKSLYTSPMLSIVFHRQLEFILHLYFPEVLKKGSRLETILKWRITPCGTNGMNFETEVREGRRVGIVRTRTDRADGNGMSLKRQKRFPLL